MQRVRTRQRVRRLCAQSDLPIRLVYRQSKARQNTLVRSAFQSSTCQVRKKYKQQNLVERTCGKPRDDCLACQAGLKEPEYDRLEGYTYSSVTSVTTAIYGRPTGKSEREAENTTFKPQIRSPTQRGENTCGQSIQT